MPTIRTKLSRAEVEAMLRKLPATLAGKSPDPTGDGINVLMLAVGVEALSIIKEAFVVKARGGQDEAGIKWAPLKRETVAYGRRHPGLTRIRKSAANKGRSGRPLLTESQDKLWRGIYAGALRWGVKNGMGQAAAAGRAAGIAWTAVKKAGGKTIIGEYGDTPVEILRDTGRLLNSLSPNAPEPADQILEPVPGGVRVGSNVVYAGTHHYGLPKKNIPARPLWPKDDAWPDVWLQRLQDTFNDGVEILLRKALGA